MSHRGKALQPIRECDYCNKQLPEMRHPNSKYCDTVCRGRDRWQRDHVGSGVKCLDCGKQFVRVGSHVVQVHGYENVTEYRISHGLLARETRTEEHAANMRGKVSSKAIDNLLIGEPYRFTVGGDHSDKLKQFWNNWRKYGRTRK